MRLGTGMGLACRVVLVLFPVLRCVASEAEVRAGVEEFLTALHNLDIARANRGFEEDATVFHHGGGSITRIDSSDQWRKVQAETFVAIKAITAKEGRTTPPYHNVGARDLRVQMLSADAAVATFQMPNPGFVRRASLVFVRRDGAWKIVHMHTSNRNVPK